MTVENETGKLLQVDSLTVRFGPTSGGVVANDNVSLSIASGETLGIIGESGSGKSVLCRAMMRLLPSPPASVTARRLAFAGRDLLALDERELCRMRGRDIAMIFQNPMTSLDPVQTIGSQIEEPLRLHRGLSRRTARAATIELLDRVGIPSASSRAGDYPHQWSGGMLQRASIAMAMAAGPRLLIADEPTTALDVTVQDQILALLLELQSETGMALVLVSHDMGVIAETSDRIAVMYAGKIVETGTTAEVFNRAAHPYSRGLLESIPRHEETRDRLHTIPGQPPDLAHLPSGCAFNPRCAFASDICAKAPPQPYHLEGAQTALCHHPQLAVGTPIEKVAP